MPLIGTLTESFSSALDGVKWPAQGGTTATGGVGVQSCVTGDYGNALQSAAAYTLQGSSVYLKVVPTPASAGTGVFTSAGVYTTAADGQTGIVVLHDADTGALKFIVRTAWAEDATQVTYDQTGHAYWRIESSGSNIIFSTSPDGSTWTSRRTVAAPSWVASETTLYFKTQTFRSTGTAAASATYDNINTLTAPAPTALSSVSSTMSAALGSAWSVPAGFAVSGGVGTFTAGAAAQPTVATSSFAYSFSNSLVCVELVSAPTATDSLFEVGVVPGSAGGGYVMYVRNGTLRCEARPAGAYWESGVGVAYDSVAMRWLGFRDTGSAVEYVASPDGWTWTVLRTVQRLAYMVHASGCGMTLSTNGGTAGATAVVDNINTPPTTAPPPVAPPGDFFDTFEGYAAGVWQEGSPSPQSSKWNVVYNGGGTLAAGSSGGDKCLIARTNNNLVLSYGYSAVGDIDMTWRIQRVTSTSVADWQDLKLYWGYTSDSLKYEFLTRQLGVQGTVLGWTVLRNGAVLSTGVHDVGTTAPVDVRIQHAGSTVTVTVGVATPVVVSSSAPSQPGFIGFQSQGPAGFEARVFDVVADGTGTTTPPPTSIVAPGAPTQVSATAGVQSATIVWQPPVSDGGSPVLQYRISRTGSSDIRTVGAGERSYVWQGLPEGVGTTLSVTAANAVGAGAAAAAAQVVPLAPSTSAGAPSQPTGVVASVDGTTVTVNWTASTGGVDTYTVSLSNGMTLTVPGTSAVFGGLMPNVPVVATVYATNANGNSPASIPSNQVTPSAGDTLESVSAFGAIISSSVPSEQAVADYEQAVGERLNPLVAVIHPDTPATVISKFIETAARHDRYAMFRVDMSGIMTASVASGSYDTRLAGLAGRLAAGGRTVFVSAYWEGNEWSQPWSPNYRPGAPGWTQVASCATQSVAELRTAFGRFSRAMHAVPNVWTVWEVNVDPMPNTAQDQPINHYPAGYVDVIALVGRNMGDGPGRDGEPSTVWRSHTDIFSGRYAEFRAAAPDRDIWLVAACHDPSTVYAPTSPGYPSGSIVPIDTSHSKAAWCTALWGDTSMLDVRAVIWDDRGGSRNFAAASSPSALTGLRQAINPGCPPEPVTTTAYEQVQVQQPAMSGWVKDAIDKFATWLRSGSGAALQAENPYPRPDGVGTGVRGLVAEAGVPTTPGRKNTGYTVTEGDLAGWNTVHGYMLRHAARHGMATCWQSSGSWPVDYPLLLHPGTVTADGMVLQPTNDGASGVGVQHDGGSLDQTSIVNAPPTVSLTVSPSSGLSPVAVTANATASDPDGAIASYAFTWGDGSPSETGANPTASHTYTSSTAASYTATCTVTDNKGATSSASAVVTVNPAPSLTVPGAPQSVVWTASNAAATIAWQPPATDGGSPITGYTVSRDGVDSTGGGPYTTTLSAGARSFSFTLLNNGSTYNLSVAAVNANGTGPAQSKAVTPTSGSTGGGTPPPPGTIDYTYTVNFASVARTISPEHVGYGCSTYGNRPDENAEMREAERRSDARLIRLPIGYRNGMVTTSADGAAANYPIANLVNIYKGWGRSIVAVAGGSASDFYSDADYNARNATKMFQALGQANILWSSSNEPDNGKTDEVGQLRSFNNIWSEGVAVFGSGFKLWGPVGTSFEDPHKNRTLAFLRDVDYNRLAGISIHQYGTGYSADSFQWVMQNRTNVYRNGPPEMQNAITSRGGPLLPVNWDEMNYAYRSTVQNGGQPYMEFRDARNTVFIASAIARSLSVGAYAMPYSSQNGYLGMWTDGEVAGALGRPLRTPMPGLWGIQAYTGGFVDDGTTRRFPHFKDRVYTASFTTSTNNLLDGIALNNESGGYNIVLSNADAVQRGVRLSLSNVPAGSYRYFQTVAANPFSAPVQYGPFPYTSSIDIPCPATTVTTVVLTPGA